MFKTKNQLNPTVFDKKFENISHHYPTRFSKYSFYEPHRQRDFLQFAISSRAPCLWNKILPAAVKELENISLFKKKVKEILMNLENETKFF